MSADPKRLIFTVTTGRSGTAYLATLLGILPGCCVGHEAPPEFTARPGDPLRFLQEEKLPAIAHCREDIYIETSHLFGKGYFEPLVALGRTPDLILLSRPHRLVAQSLYSLDTIPGRSQGGLTYYLSPADPGTLPVKSPDTLHDYQLCYWYCLEMERRQGLYGAQVGERGGRVVAVTLEDLVEGDGFARLVEELALPRPGPLARVQLAALRRKPINTKAHKKKRFLAEEEMTRLEADLLGRISA
jgi:hypothetical protein